MEPLKSSHEVRYSPEWRELQHATRQEGGALIRGLFVKIGDTRIPNSVAKLSHHKSGELWSRKKRTKNQGRRIEEAMRELWKIGHIKSIAKKLRKSWETTTPTAWKIWRIRKTSKR